MSELRQFHVQEVLFCIEQYGVINKKAYFKLREDSNSVVQFGTEVDFQDLQLTKDLLN